MYFYLFTKTEDWDISILDLKVNYNLKCNINSLSFYNSPIGLYSLDNLNLLLCFNTC